MTDKDYSLLRPFSEAAAKRGEAICSGYDGEIVKFIAGPDAVGNCCVLPDGGEFGFHKALLLAMAPLAWVEGKPVYKGDVLEVEMDDGDTLRWMAIGVDEDALLGVSKTPHSIPLEDVEAGRSYFHWPRPKPVKRWVNVYADKYGDLLHETKDAADAAVSRHRVACIEIELPPLENKK